jgi:hypothetical protein
LLRLLPSADASAGQSCWRTPPSGVVDVRSRCQGASDPVALQRSVIEHADDAPIVIDLLLLLVWARRVLVVSAPEDCSVVSFKYGDDASVMATGSLAVDGV